MASEGKCADLIVAYIESGDEGILHGITGNVLSNAVTLLEVVMDMKNYMIHSDAYMRCRATKLLADISNKLAGDFFSKKEVKVLWDYFCGKLQDHFSIQPHAISGLLSLSYRDVLDGDMIQRSCSHLFTDVNTQSLSDGCRTNVFKFLFNLLKKYIADIKAFQHNFVSGFIDAIGGERDPRNLLLVFASVTLVGSHLSLGPYAEDLFDSIACYFPIDYNPPKHEITEVSREILYHSLRNAFSSSIQFEPFILPFLMEKIKSEVLQARRDGFDTLASCSFHDPHSLKPYFEEFLGAVKTEIYSHEPHNAGQEASQCVVEIVTALNQLADEKFIKDFVQGIFMEFSGNLENSSSLFFSASSRLFSSVIISSKTSAMVLSAVLPSLLKQFTNLTSSAAEETLLKSVVNLFEKATLHEISTDVKVIIGDLENSLSNLLDTNKNRSSTTLSLVLSAFKHLIHARVSLHYIDGLVKRVWELSLSEEAKMRENAIDCMKEISQLYPEIVESMIVPQLFSQECSQNTDVINSICGNKVIVMNILSSVLKQSLLLNSGEHIAILRCLKVIIYRYNNDPEILETFHSEITQHLINSCLSCGSTPELNHHTCNPTNHQDLLNSREDADICDKSSSLPTSNIILKGCIDTSCICRESRCHYVGQILQLLVLHLPSESSNQLAAQIHCLFLVHSFNGLVSVANSATEVEVTSSTQREDIHQSSLLTLVMNVSSACNPENILNLEFVLVKLRKVSILEKCSTCRLLAAKSYAAIINKCQDGEFLELRLNNVFHSLFDNLSTDSFMSETCIDGGNLFPNAELHVTATNYLVLLVWISKSLELRGHSVSFLFTKKLLSLLSDPELGVEATEGVLLILSGCDVMNRNLRSNVKIFYQQRFIQNYFQNICEGCLATKSDCLLNYQRLFFKMLGSCPQYLLEDHNKKILPILLASLSSDDPGLLLATLEALTSRINDSVSHDLDRVVTRLLNISHVFPFMKIRMKSLECLTSVTSLPYHVLHPHRKPVIRGLEHALNDKKRLVRSAAVLCRRKWFLLGES